MTGDPIWLDREVWKPIQRSIGVVPDGVPGTKTAAAVQRLILADARGSEGGTWSFGGSPIRAGVDRDPSNLLPEFAAKVAILFDRLRERGLSPLLWEGYRSLERAQGLSDRGAGIKLSMHCLGAAVDIIHADDYWSAGREFWDALGEESEALGLVWGGRWRRRDYPHVQAVALRDQHRFRRMSVAERRAHVA